MKRIFLFITFTTWMICSLCAASRFDMTYDEIKNGVEGELNITMNLKGQNTAEIGFSDNEITKNGDEIQVASVRSLDSLNKATGLYTLSAPKEFYIYWKLNGSPQKLPKIYLEIVGPLTATPDKGFSVDWTASWNEGSVTSLKNDGAISKKQVFPRTGDDTTSNFFKSYCSSIKIGLETNTPFWTVPPAKYEGDLFVRVESSL